MKGLQSTGGVAGLMKSIKRIARLLQGSKGLATSLVEATATIAVGTVLAGTAATVGLDALEAARIATTSGQVSEIGQAVVGFYVDNGVYPGYETGTSTGPADLTFAHIGSRK